MTMKVPSIIKTKTGFIFDIYYLVLVPFPEGSQDPFPVLSLVQPAGFLASGLDKLGCRLAYHLYQK